jgi:hypothetical protein
MAKEPKLTREEQIEKVQDIIEERNKLKQEILAKRKQANSKVDFYPQFQEFWAQNRKKYNQSKEIGEIIWIHLLSSGYAEPEKFEEGIKHFGL